MRTTRPGASLLVFVAGLLLAGSATQAQAPHDRSVDEYRNATRRALHACSGPAPETSPPARAGETASAHCVAAAKHTVSDKFDAAMASSMDPVVRAAMQRYQAAFLTSLAGVAPLPGEGAGGYEQRQSGLRCALSHAWSEIELSEAQERFPTAKAKR